MKRKVIAAVWVLGATMPLLAGTLFLVGCCVLPFHRVVHQVMPLCHVVMNAAAGETEEPATPASEQKPVKRFAGHPSPTLRFEARAEVVAVTAPTPIQSYRSFITLGAIRCDSDIGLHVLGETFLI